MPFTREDIDGLLPNLRNLVEPRVEQRLFEAFRRVYEIMFLRFEQQQKDFDARLNRLAEAANTNINNLIGVFPQPLAGSPNADPELQSIVGSFGSPEFNTFLAGPIPTFKPISLSDLGLSGIEQGEYLKVSGGVIVGGFPIGTTSLADGIVPTVETILYTTPAGSKTLFRILILQNNSSSPLDVNVKTKTIGNVIIYSNTFTVPASDKLNLILNLIIEAGQTIRIDTTVADTVSYSIFGSQEPI